MNIDFGSNPGFSAYVLLLMFSGLVMVCLASPAVKQSKAWLRVLNALIGLAFFGYGFYLAFLFQGGSYVIFFQAFILPIALVVRTLAASRAAKAQQAAAAAAPQWPAAQWPPAPDGQQWAGQPWAGQQPPQWQGQPPQQWAGQQPQQWDAPPQQWPQPQPQQWTSQQQGHDPRPEQEHNPQA